MSDFQVSPYLVQRSQRSQWRAYSKPPSLFRMVPSPILYDPFPKMEFHINSRYANGHISATGDQIHFMFVTRLGFSSCFGHYNRSCLLTYLLSGSADRMALFPVISSWRQVLSWIIWNGHISATADSIHLSLIARSSLR